MEKLIIVVGDHKHPNAHHLKLNGTVCVGRALSCDVILSDSYVEPVQLVFHQQEDKRSVEVMAGINPVRRNGVIINNGTYDFVSGDEWAIGRSIVLAFNESHSVEPTEKLLMHDYRGSGYANAAMTLMTILILATFLLLSQWLSSYAPWEWKEEFSELTPTLAVVFIWAAVWAVIGRFMTGKNLFVVHFAAVAIFVVTTEMTYVMTDYLSYALNMGLFWEISQYLISSLLIGLLLYINFAYATNIKNMKIMQLMVGLCFGAFLYVFDHQNDNKLEPQFNHSVKAPWAIGVKAETVENFMDRTDKGFAEVIKKAAE